MAIYYNDTIPYLRCIYFWYRAMQAKYSSADLYGWTSVNGDYVVVLPPYDKWNIAH